MKVQWQVTATVEPGLDFGTTSRELRRNLEAAVAMWMVADVEAGSFLSGGLDSSIIAALAQKVRQTMGLGPLKTFAVGTQGSSDLAAARAVAEHIGSDHCEAVFSAQDVADALPHV